MKPRHRYRLVGRQRANAAYCGVAITEWLALSRTQRRDLIEAAERDEYLRHFDQIHPLTCGWCGKQECGCPGYLEVADG
jgi:hypothetical protein